MAYKVYTMYCGALNGELVLGHLFSRARDVRSSVASMFHEHRTTLGDCPACKDPKGGWTCAAKQGWRVVPVIIMQRSDWALHR